MVFPASVLLIILKLVSLFQSLIGFYGFSGSAGFQHPEQFFTFWVSIPDRVLWFFRLKSWEDLESRHKGLSFNP